MPRGWFSPPLLAATKILAQAPVVPLCRIWFVAELPISNRRPAPTRYRPGRSSRFPASRKTYVHDALFHCTAADLPAAAADVGFHPGQRPPHPGEPAAARRDEGIMSESSSLYAAPEFSWNRRVTSRLARGRRPSPFRDHGAVGRRVERVDEAASGEVDDAMLG